MTAPLGGPLPTQQEKFAKQPSGLGFAGGNWPGILNMRPPDPETIALRKVLWASVLAFSRGNDAGLQAEALESIEAIDLGELPEPTADGIARLARQLELRCGVATARSE